MSETRATAVAFPPGRYGRRRDGRRRRLVPVLFAVVFGLASLGLSYALYDKFGRTDYDPQIIGWSDPTDSEMVVKFRVRVPAGKSASCVVRARDYGGFEVGRRTVTVPAPGGGGSVEVAEAVPTRARGSVGDVMGCRPAG